MTSTPTPSIRQAAKWLKHGAVILTTFLVCWTCMLWYWRKTHTDPETAELALTLLVLPVVLLLCFWKAGKAAAYRDAAYVAAGVPGGGAEAYADLDQELADDDGFPAMHPSCASARRGRRPGPPDGVRFKRRAR